MKLGTGCINLYVFATSGGFQMDVLATSLEKAQEIVKIWNMENDVPFSYSGKWKHASCKESPEEVEKMELDFAWKKYEYRKQQIHES